MTFTQNFLPSTIPAFTNLPLLNLEVFTIHWVGPYPGQTPLVVRDWWESSGLTSSGHFVIKDDECLQCWPTHIRAWHCGDDYGNAHSLSFEIIPSNTEGLFSDSSISTLKTLLDLLDSTGSIPLMRHYDWSGKDCPSYYIDDDRWVSLTNALGRPLYT